jgi:hypothetical protein
MKNVTLIALIAVAAAPLWAHADAIHAATGIGHFLTPNGFPAAGGGLTDWLAALI